MSARPPQTIDEWLTLPQLELRREVVTCTVLRLGALFAPRKAALDAGVSDPWSPSEDRKANVVLGTATLQTEAGPVLLRLPGVLAEWASDVLALTREGVRLLPCRFRLRLTDAGVEVVPLSAPSDPTRSDDDDIGSTMTVFVDESGNTGDAAVSAASGFGGQRVFALVGVAEGDGAASIAAALADARARHRVRAEEIKNRTMARNPELVVDLVRSLAARNAIFVEVMDKKFYLTTNIVSYALHGSRFDPLQEASLANEFAEVLTDVVDDAAVVAYSDFGRARDEGSFEAFEVAFRGALLGAKLRLAPHQEREFQLLDAVGSRFLSALEERRCDPTTFLPPPDTDRRGRLLPMLPHVPAFANLLGRINRHASRSRSVRVIHDHQAQFEGTLRDTLAMLEANAGRMTAIAWAKATAHTDWDLTGRIRLGFADSKAHSGLQAADVIARFCTQRMTAALSGDSLPRSLGAAAAALQNLGRPGGGPGVNIVATYAAVEKFWSGR